MKKAGPRAWRRIRNEIEKLPCPECRDHGMLMIDGAQDTINVNKLNRPMHNPERFAEFKAEVDRAASTGAKPEGSQTFELVLNPNDDELLIGAGLGVAGLLIAFVLR